MDIRRIGNIPGEVSQPLKKQKVSVDKANASNDRIEISDSARAAQEASLLSKLSQSGPDVRADRVAEVRQSLQEGKYFSSEMTHRLAEKLADLL